MSDNKQTEERAQLARKMLKVMEGIEEVPKRGRNSHYNYDYPLDADVMEALREQMIAQGLIVMPSVEAYETETRKTQRKGGGTKVMYHSEIRLSIKVVDSETGAAAQMYWAGEASDNQDKGLYKAYTSAIKYWALKTFLMSANDDVETADAGAPARGGGGGAPMSGEPTQKQVNYAKALASEEVWNEGEKTSLTNKIGALDKQGLSDLIENMQEEVEKRKAKKANASSGRRYSSPEEAIHKFFSAALNMNPEADGIYTINSKQLKLLYAKSGEFDWEGAALDRMCKGFLGLDSKTNIPSGQPFEEILDAVESEEMKFWMHHDVDTGELFDEGD